MKSWIILGTFILGAASYFGTFQLGRKYELNAMAAANQRVWEAFVALADQVERANRRADLATSSAVGKIRAASDACGNSRAPADIVRQFPGGPELLRGNKDRTN